MKLNCEKPSVTVSCSPVSEIVSEKLMCAMTTLNRTIFDLKETDQRVSKNRKTLQIGKIIFKDTTDCILLVSKFKVSKVWKTKGYQITKTCVYLFKFQRMLKTTKTIDIMEDDTCRYNITEVESSGSPYKNHKRHDRQTFHVSTVQAIKNPM